MQPNFQNSQCSIVLFIVTSWNAADQPACHRESAQSRLPYRLYDKPGILWRDATLGGDIQIAATPASAGVGVAFEFTPIAVVTLSASYFYSWWFAISAICNFADLATDYADSHLEQRQHADLNYAASGHDLVLGLQFIGQ
ncbi:MAG: hypothetical protein R3C68_19685 [Myxococcota bacterium]